MVAGRACLSVLLLAGVTAWSVPALAGGQRIARTHHVRAANGPGPGMRHPILALTGDYADPGRSYDRLRAVPGDRPMPTRLDYRVSDYGPVISVGYEVSNVGGSPDPHNATAAATASRFGSPDGLLGANLSYTFR